MQCNIEEIQILCYQITKDLLRERKFNERREYP